MKSSHINNRPRLRLSALLGLAVAATSLPTLASPVRADVGKEIEKGLGQMVAKELEATYGVVDDPLLAGWVDRLGQKLAAVSGRTDLKYTFKILASDDVNASAAPGGYIFINRGTLRFIQSEDELAAVMGHEVGHVAGKHAMKQLNAQLIGTLLLAGFQAIHAETLRTVGGMAGGLAMLKFTRDEENDADRRGLKNATAAGYDGREMLTFFKRMQSTEREKPTKFETYFMTHPPTEERLRRVRDEQGTADTAANATAIGDGQGARSLYRAATASYRKALDLDQNSADARKRLADARTRTVKWNPAVSLGEQAKAMRLQQLAQLASDLTGLQETVREDQRKLEEARRDTERELEMAARSLTQASQMINRHDALQIRHFMAMARSFDQAVKVGANLRAASEMADSALADYLLIQRSVKEAVERGDGAAAGQVDGLVMTGQSAVKNVGEGLRQARNQAGDAKSGIRSLRVAADSLVNSYRMPLGFTSGQFDILNLQVSTATDGLKDSVEESRKALALVAQAKLDALLRRINFVTRSVPADDPAAAGIVAHYLGTDPAEVRAMRERMGCGDAALALAEQVVLKARAAKKRGKDEEAKLADARKEAKRDAKERPLIQPENATVLFHLMAKDLERETAPYSRLAADTLAAATETR